MRKSKFRSVVMVLIVLSVCFGFLAGCGSEAETVSVESSEDGFYSKDKPAFVGDPEETYYFIDFVSGVDYWVSLYEGFKDIGRQLGVKTVYTGTTEFDINAQVALFDQIVAKRPAGIYLCPINGEPFLDAVNAAKEKGIPVTLYTNGIDGMNYVSYVDHNNELDSAKAADFVGQELGGKGEVAIFETLGQDNHEKRVYWFIDRLEKKWPGIKVVSKANTQHSVEKGAESAKTIIQAHPEVDYFFSVSANSAMGGAIAIEEINAQKNLDVKIITFDCDPQILDLIKQGQVSAAVQPDAYMFGYFGLWTLFCEKNELLDPLGDNEAAGRYRFQLPLVYPSSMVVTAENADYFYTNLYLERRGSKGFEESGSDMTNPDLPGFWRR